MRRRRDMGLLDVAKHTYQHHLFTETKHIYDKVRKTVSYSCERRSFVRTASFRPPIHHDRSIYMRGSKSSIGSLGSSHVGQVDQQRR